MGSFYTIFIFVVTLSILVLVHEYGHYRMAKLCGVKVLRFSIGFGKPLFTWKVGKDQTEFAITPYLFGGYVRMLDSRESLEKTSDNGRNFNSKPLIQRALIVCAGPAANFILAIVLLAATAMIGLQSFPAKLAQPKPDSMLAHAGIHAGDEVIGIRIGQEEERFRDIFSLDDLAIYLYYATSNEKDVTLKLKQPDGQTGSATLAFTDLGAKEAGRNLLLHLGFDGLWLPPKLAAVTADGAAAQVGLRAGDLIRSINGTIIHDGRQLVQAIQEMDSSRPSNFVVERNGTSFHTLITPHMIEIAEIAALKSSDAAYQAGLRNGDIVRAINGRAISDYGQYHASFQTQKTSATVDWAVERDGRLLKIPFTFEFVEVKRHPVSQIGIQLGQPEKITTQYGFLDSVSYGWSQTWLISRLILTSIGQMIVGKAKVQDNLSGPIEIANIASKSAQRGLPEYISFLAKISISLAVLNLLPLPVLDGGHLVLYMIEAVRRRPLSDRAISMLQRLGVFLLLVLMIFVTFNDIFKLL